MATKKKKKKNRSSIKLFSKQDKYYKIIYSGTFVAEYKNLINYLPKERYLSKIFFNPKFVLYWSFLTKSAYDTCKARLDAVYSNFDIDDIYTYLKLNHELNKHKEERNYLYSVFELINDLSVGYLIQDIEYLPEPKRYFVYGPVMHNKKNTVNTARDFLYNNYSYGDLRNKYGFNREDYKRKMKEIYQSELLPIDISQRSY